MKPLSEIIEKYAAFEADVNAYTTKIFQKSCSVCNGACCRPEICEESLASPFLERLRQRFAADAAFSDDRGWLKPVSYTHLTLPTTIELWCGRGGGGG